MANDAIENIRAIVTTQWNKKMYRPRIIRTIEQYYVDTALDNDSDPFSIDIGDPDGDLVALLQRDSEVRVQLFGIASSLKANSYILRGFADEISYTDEGIVTLTGRDITSVATDSIVPPKQYRRLRAWQIVAQQARELGIGGRLNLARHGIVKKAQYTDGSETYWEFWHRLYRKEKMWIWAGPDGSLNANRLSYNAQPSYFFGEPKSKEPARIRRLYIPVDTAQVHKSTQGRLGQIWVYGHRGDNGFLRIQDDPTTRKWIRRPRKIMMDTDARTPKAALRTAWEEIFETKVGAMEYIITIPDPGFMIRQNRIARVRIPSMKLNGNFFVVGVRMQAGMNGAMVEVRLRERQYAISRRVPQEPKLKTGEPKRGVRNELGETLGLDVPHAGAFVKAAREFHGPWNFSLFLATLIAIGDQETGGRFANVRAHGGPGEDQVTWYQWKAADRTPDPQFPDDLPRGSNRPSSGGTPRDRHGRTRQQWEQAFANEPGSRWTDQTFAVGIMQLWSLGYKHKADDYFRPGHRDQYTGGRWDIESNIRAGAYALRNKLQVAVRDSGRDIDMWAGVSYYGHHYKDESPTTVPTKYAVAVKNKVYNDPGYLTTIQAALEAAREAVKAQRDGATDGVVSDTPGAGVPPGLPTEAEALKIIRGLGPAPNKNAQRNGVVAAAMYGYYNRDQIGYTREPQRGQDFGPPPNVPGNTDCSAFATWCYKSARANDPNGVNYSTIGYTGTLVDRGVSLFSIAQLKPGDLVFYGGSPSAPGHVAIYVGYGKCISHGSEGGPFLVNINYRADRNVMKSYLG